MSIKLADTQLIVLRAAAQREARCLVSPKNLKGGVMQKSADRGRRVFRAAVWPAAVVHTHAPFRRERQSFLSVRGAQVAASSREAIGIAPGASCGRARWRRRRQCGRLSRGLVRACRRALGASGALSRRTRCCDCIVRPVGRPAVHCAPSQGRWASSELSRTRKTSDRCSRSTLRLRPRLQPVRRTISLIVALLLARLRMTALVSSRRRYPA